MEKIKEECNRQTEKEKKNERERDVDDFKTPHEERRVKVGKVAGKRVGLREGGRCQGRTANGQH